jgi:hypothetical protein
LRYDQVTVIDEHSGWFFAQKLAQKARKVVNRKPTFQNSGFGDRFKAVLQPPDGLGFDADWHDGYVTWF